MRSLFLHSDFIEIEAKERAIKQAEEICEKYLRVKEALVVFVSVEEKDRDVQKCSEALVENIIDIAGKLGVNRIVLYPYVHLTSKPSDPKTALEILEKSEEILKKRGYEVYRAPFGWYKSFTIKVKGHPLSELSRTITIKSEEKKPMPKKFLIVYPDGSEKKPEEANCKELSEDFRRLVEKEALGKELEGGEPIVSEAMKRFGFEWELNSDHGHMRYKPYAALLIDLVSDYAIKISNELNVPIFVVKGTNMFDLKEGPIAEHAKLFGDRLYEIETDKSKFILRYAACFQQFLIAKDLIISYKQLPFGMLEIADSYRYEQPGECTLGFRMRKFWMPDLHIFCKDLEDAKKWFLEIHNKIMEEIRKIGRDYELLINVGSNYDYKAYKHLIVEISKKINKPVLVCIYDIDDPIFYWTINIEYHIIDLLGRPREIGTTQIDVGNSKRFNIKYVDESGKEKYPIILHNALIGSVERYIYAIFDTALRKNKPCLPVWLSPTQVRIIPVSEKYKDYCINLAKELYRNCIRVEVDDRNDTVGKKIRDAEKMWVPYIVVVGEKEVSSGKLSVRVRETGEVGEMTLQELLDEIWGKTRGYPFRYQYWPIEISKNPFLH